MLTALLLLLPAIAGGCAATRTAPDRELSDDRLPASDSSAVFVPTHPPVVVPHAWNETLPSQKNQ